MKEHINQEEYSSMVNNNTILLRLEGWIKYIEGFTKGLQTTDMVNSAAVLDCIGEIMEFMSSFRNQISKLFIHCEQILSENEELNTNKELALLENKNKEPYTIEDAIYEELIDGNM